MKEWHSFTGYPIEGNETITYRCECGYEFVDDGRDYDETREKIKAHRREMIRETDQKALEQE